MSGQDESWKKGRYTLPAPPTPKSTPNPSPASSFRRSTPSGKRRGDQLPPVTEEGGRGKARSDDGGSETQVLSPRALDITLGDLVDAQFRRGDTYPSRGAGANARGGQVGTTSSPQPSSARSTGESSSKSAAQPKTRIHRSFTETDVAHNGSRDVAITITHSRNRSGLKDDSNFFGVIRDTEEGAPGKTKVVRNRSMTAPHRRSSFMRGAENAFPRVLSAVKELEMSLAEEKLDEIPTVTNLEELDKQLVMERRTPRGSRAVRPRPSVLKKDTLGLHKGDKGIAAATKTSSLASESSASGNGGYATSEGTEAMDATAYGEHVESMEGVDDLFISKRLPLDRIAPLCQRCAATCTLNIMHGKEYTLRNATEVKLRIYQVVTSKIYHIFILLLSIFHVILASFEPASIDMLASNNDYINLARDNVLLIESTIVSIYIFDICIERILSTNRIFWRQKLNLSRILCTGIMCLDLILAYCDIGVPRFSRFLRPVQCILLSKNLYDKLISVLQAAMAAAKPLSLLILTTFVFSVAGMELFSDWSNWIQFEEEKIECDFNFSNVYRAFVSLYVLVTTENFPCVMMPAIRGKLRLPKGKDGILVENLGVDLTGYDVYSRNNQNYTQLTSSLYQQLRRNGHVEESRILHVVFFVVFLLITTFGVVNVLIASVYNSYRQHAIQTSYIKRTKERKSLLIAYELLTMNKMMTRESIFGSPYESKEDAYLDYLTFRDLVKMTMGSYLDEEKLVFYWNKIDTDKSGYVDPLEFLSLVDVLGLTLFRVCETNLAKITVKSIWRTQLKRFVRHKAFQLGILTLLIANAIMLCTKGIVSQEEYRKILIMNDILSLVYLFESLLKVAALGREYWKGIWNRYDCVTVLMGVLAAILRLKPVANQIDSTFVGSIALVIFILSNILRIMRIMTIGKKESNQFLLLLFRILPTSLSFLMLTFLVCCVYAYIGIEIFSKFNENNHLDNDYFQEFASFSSFSSALVLIFQVLTTSNFHEI
ncbi:ion transporter [Chloropicon primus]|uniref:Ion transporter n=1 Tax=Chloropicon primus TaxID=1764295 RepID=A0A5B8MHY3_9CHLO|nr:ion transporter [Chloropicon primus]UPQ99259.1 ion transporter [Chloropicon primus]|eukprot:QDZ20047.1 ion transporter [Chloropicon primus]